VENKARKPVNSPQPLELKPLASQKKRHRFKGKRKEKAINPPKQKSLTPFFLGLSIIGIVFFMYYADGF